MYQLYEKVPKTKQYMQGSRLIEDGENPFMQGPCFLCIAAADTLDKSVFGITKQGMKMSRLRVRGEQNAGYDLRGFPVKFLSMKLNIRDEEKRMTPEERIECFVHKYLLPLVSDNGKRIDCNKAMRQMRNVNILSYCDATVTAQNIEESLIGLMQELGYTSEEIDMIQSQMCMFPIATNRLEGKQKSTCISFKDINDEEVSDDITPEIAQSVYDSPIGEQLVRYSNNELAYYISSNGAHTVKAYTKMGQALPVCLSSAISKALENSINNASNVDEFIPVTAQLLTEDFLLIMQGAQKGISKEEQLKMLDMSLDYKGARKLSDFEMELLDQLDESYDMQIRVTRELKTTQDSLNKERGKLIQTDKGIEENCSDVTRLKILAARGYQLIPEQKVLVANSPSDRELLGDRQQEIRTTEKGMKNIHFQIATNLQESVEESRRLDEEIATLTAQKEK